MDVVDSHNVTRELVRLPDVVDVVDVVDVSHDGRSDPHRQEQQLDEAWISVSTGGQFRGSGSTPELKAGKPGKSRRETMDRDGAVRVFCLLLGRLYGWMGGLAADGQMGNEVLSEVQLAETLPTYVESHRACDDPNDKQVDTVVWTW